MSKTLNEMEAELTEQLVYSSHGGWEIYKDYLERYIIKHNGVEVDKCISFEIAYPTLLQHRNTMESSC